MNTIIWILILLLCFGVSTAILSILRFFDAKPILLKSVASMAGLVFILPFVLLTIHRRLNSVIILLHICVFWVFVIIVDSVIEHVSKKRGKESVESAGDRSSSVDSVTSTEKEFSTEYIRNYKQIRRFTAVIFGCFVYLAIGYLCAHQVRTTEQTVVTDKTLLNHSIHIAQISDVHLGTTIDGAKFARLLDRIEAENVDILVVTGDLIDSYTSREDMIAGCKAFADIKTKYGIYYVAGNHDIPETGWDFTEEDFLNLLKENGVVVLRDETVLINDSFYVIGRKDRSESRKSIAELTEGLDDSKYQIVLDHQPNDFEKEAASGVDLVVCGHTHGGYLIPVKWFAPLFMENLFGDTDRFSGMETRGNTTFFVSDGVGTWGCSFKTGAFSEYVLFEITDR